MALLVLAAIAVLVGGILAGVTAITALSGRRARAAEQQRRAAAARASEAEAARMKKR